LKKIIHKYYYIILIFLLSLIYNCTGSGSNEILEEIRISELKQRINKNSELITSLEASGNIAFDSPEQSGQGWFDLKIKKPDTVFIKITGPFGISIANALITRKDFIYYNVQENKAIYGPTNEINIGAILRIKVTFDELINGFTGMFAFYSEPNDTLAAESERGMYLIKTNENELLKKYFIDPGLFIINKYNSFDINNKPLVEVNYEKYFEESASGKKIYFPSSIKVKNILKKQSVYIDYANKEFNKSNLTFNIKIPKSATIIKWD
jgi:hypothetical protein